MTCGTNPMWVCALIIGVGCLVVFACFAGIVIQSWFQTTTEVNRRRASRGLRRTGILILVGWATWVSLALIWTRRDLEREIKNYETLLEMRK